MWPCLYTAMYLLARFIHKYNVPVTIKVNVYRFLIGKKGMCMSVNVATVANHQLHNFKLFSPT